MEEGTRAKNTNSDENIWFPEPIIEELESEISSPVAQTYLLGESDSLRFVQPLLTSYHRVQCSPCP